MTRPLSRAGSILRTLLLVLATPAALGAYVRYPVLAGLAYLTLVPWVLLYTDDRRPRVSVGWYVLAAWLTIPLLYPQTFDFGWQFPIAFATAYFLPWVPFVPILRRVHRTTGLPRTLTVPVAWVTVEWLRIRFSMSHFDLYALGYSQALFTPLIQIADITGVYGVSFLVAAANGLCADLFFAWRDGGRKLTPLFRQRRLRWSAGGVAGAALLMLAYGALRLSGLVQEPGPRLVLVQPNIRHHGANAAGVHLTQVLLTEDEVKADEDADLIIWPENAVLANPLRERFYLEDLQWLAERKGAWLLVGAMGEPVEHPGRNTNTALLIDSAGAVVGRYDKQILFPWSEFVPADTWLGEYARSLQHLHRKLVRQGWGFLPSGLPGHTLALLEMDWQGEALPFGVLICVENTYPPLPAAAGRRGARFLVNITSEGEVGGTVQEQLLRISRFRAVENRISYVRVGNTGISGFIDPAGRLRRVLEGRRGAVIFDQGVLADHVYLSRGGATVYARTGEAFAWLCLGSCAALLLWTLVRRHGGAIAATVVMLTVAGCVGPPELGRRSEIAAAELDRGRRLLEQGQHEQALEALLAACGEPSSCSRALAPLAAAFTAAREPENGADVMAAVVERYPSLAAEALAHRGAMLEEALEWVEAQRVFERSIEVEPTPLAQLGLGGLLERMNRGGEAIEVYRAAVRGAPEHAELRYRLGRTLLAEGQLKEAHSMLVSVLRDAPAHASAWVPLGQVYLARGENEAARTSFRQAIEVDDTNITARLMLARLALREGRRTAAQVRLAEILRIESALARGRARDE